MQVPEALITAGNIIEERDKTFGFGTGDLDVGEQSVVLFDDDLEGGAQLPFASFLIFKEVVLPCGFRK